MTQSGGSWPLNVPGGWGPCPSTWVHALTGSARFLCFPDTHLSWMRWSGGQKPVWCVRGGFIGWWALGTRGRLLADEGHAVPRQTTGAGWHCSATRPKPVIQQCCLFCQDDGGGKTLIWSNPSVYLWRYNSVICTLPPTDAENRYDASCFKVPQPENYIKKKSYTTKTPIHRWRTALAEGAAGPRGGSAAFALNCVQLTSQEFDCVYEVIWCQKHWGLSGHRRVRRIASPENVTHRFVCGSRAASERSTRGRFCKSEVEKKDGGRSDAASARQVILTAAWASSNPIRSRQKRPAHRGASAAPDRVD